MAEACSIADPRPRLPATRFVVAGGLALATVASVVHLRWGDLSAVESWDAVGRSWARFVQFLAAFGAPDVSAEALADAGRMLLETLAVALLGVGLGLLLGYPLAIGACRAIVLGDDSHRTASRWLRRLVLEACRLLLDVLRGVPDFAWALVLANFWGIGTPTGVLAIGVSVAGILGKVLSEQWDNQDPQRYAFLRSTGASPLQVFLYGVQPLSARAMTSFVLMRTECAIRNASVIGVIAGSGLGIGLWDAFRDLRYDYVVTLLLAMLVLTATADVSANFLRHQLRVDPNHPRAQRRQSVQGSVVRRGLGVAACIAALAVLLWQQWPAFAQLGEELARLEGEFAWGYARKLLLTPDLSALGVALEESFVPLAVALLTTLGATLLAAALAYPASVAFQLHAGKFTGEDPSLARRAVRLASVVAARGLALVFRAVPEVAWLLILGAFFRQGLLAGVLAVTLHSTGVLLRVFVETVDNTPYRRLEQVAGACRPHIFLYGALPTAWDDWRTYAFFQFEVNMRMGIVLGMVGAGGLGEAFDGNLRYGFDRIPRACMFLWAMVALTVLVDRTSRWLQMRRLRC
ncbi:MAG TPA: ABC transporter permease subunit [Planctomycetota bacterium]|nr:ABC transporter permease subunit [Planctomycetota bacterium]